MLFAFDFFLTPRGQARRDEAAALTRVSTRRNELAADSDSRLRERAEELRRGRTLPEGSVEAIALVAESIRRTHGLAAHEVQLRAGLALAEGALVEMATGEGKTLAALLPAFCFALRGRGAHVATVNTYLAERDAAFAQPVFARLGLTVGLLRENEPNPAAKRAAYAADVTYGVGTEFGFDYLRDQLALRAAGRTEARFHEILLRRAPPKPDLLQRGHAFAVIDEADCVLIDEARSPLIISTGAKRPSATPEVYRLADEIAGGFREREHYTRDARTARLALTPEGERHAFARLTDAALLQLRRVWLQYLEHALHVRHQFRRDVHYVVAEDRVMMVDEFTGRLCHDRTWREGLHQAAEARAGVTITEENSSEATISRPAYFQLYERICGMTGTAAEAASELRETYALRTTVVPPHRPCRRALLPDRVFATRTAKHAAVAREVAARHATGQPVLIGTRTIENSEALADALVSLGLPLRLLNAKQDAGEAAIIERAGQPGAITIATNMAGRGAHIPVPEESLRVGGLHVIGLERHESARIDRQLIGRAARQGQPGSAQFFLSLEDDLLQRRAPGIAARLARSASHDELPPGVAVHFRRAQRKVEAGDRTQRRALAAQHRWLDELKQAL
ncbi:MAG: preprotein translocase subunit SecA [Chthoniobacter sp.]|jgi:preprotein translocase subunit SecA|nr:preprotein translocase subunit SecA [Chthoniobacter sp.]